MRKAAESHVVLRINADFIGTPVTSMEQRGRRQISRELSDELVEFANGYHISE